MPNNEDLNEPTGAAPLDATVKRWTTNRFRLDVTHKERVNHIIAEPQPTPTKTVAELIAMDVVGLYRPGD